MQHFSGIPAFSAKVPPVGTAAPVDHTLKDPLFVDGGTTPHRVVPLRPRAGRCDDASCHRCALCGEQFPLTYAVCPRDATPLGLTNSEKDPLVGAILGGTYRLTRVLGRGGMGRLYEAEHTRIGRAFAIKVLHESHADKPDAVRRFEREASALSRIRSEHVLDIVDVLRTSDGRMAIVTALLEGEDLQRRLDRRERLPLDLAIDLTVQLCRGLAAAHAARVIHRDLKPSNLFLESTADGRIALKILDFGVAKLASEDDMTRTGVVLGTPAYMAPEQARGSAHADPRSDIYAAGAVLYRMLTGRMPYEESEPGTTLARLLASAPPSPRTHSSEIPLAIEIVIQQAMARDPAERPQHALDLARALIAVHASEAAHGRSASPSAPKELERSVAARQLERDAMQARPAALGWALLAVFSTGALTASAFGALGGGVELVDAQRALVHALSIVGGVAAATLSLVAVMRWLRPRWASAPAVQHANARLRGGVMGGLSVMGVAALAHLGAGAISGEPLCTSGASLVAVLSCGCLASWYGARPRANRRLVR